MSLRDFIRQAFALFLFSLFFVFLFVPVLAVSRLVSLGTRLVTSFIGIVRAPAPVTR